MNYIQTEIDGVWLIEPTVYGDQRGYFMESFKQQEFEQHIGRVNFLQDNESKSVFGVLRGLHYQQGDTSGQAGARHQRHRARCGGGSPHRIAHIRQAHQRGTQ
jgi:dTDP-4-dehydrorhamnose 3,5-epimerase-like enzyme